MRVKLSRHGNSLGFVVPAAIVRDAGLEAGQEYELEVAANGEVRLSPLAATVWKPDMTLDDFLAGMPETPEKYDDVPEYVPAGRELDW